MAAAVAHTPVAPSQPALVMPSLVASSSSSSKAKEDNAAPPLDPHDFVSRSLTPFNAEPKIAALLHKGGFYTPQHLLFHRNRDPLPGRSFPGLNSNAQLRPGTEESEWTVSFELEHALRQHWNASARTYTLGQLKSAFGPTSPSIVTATLECAGNRRSEMSQVAKTEGIQWSSGVIANAAFVGLALRTFLLHSGVPDPYAHLTPAQLDALAPTASNIATHAPAWAQNTHVHFVSAQLSDLVELGGSTDARGNDAEERERRERNRWFASSISLATAMLPAQQCLLSWGFAKNAAHVRPFRTVSTSRPMDAMTRSDAAQQQQQQHVKGRECQVEAEVEPLEHAHGFPLRVVLPGHAGARWVKWIRAIRIERSMNASAPMKDDYKMLLPPAVSATTSAPLDPAWAGAFKSAVHRAGVMAGLAPLMRLTAGSAVSSPADGQAVEVITGPPSSTLGSADAAAGHAKIRVTGYAVGQDGSAVRSICLALIPDDPSLSAPELRAQAARATWTDATHLTRDDAQLRQLDDGAASADNGGRDGQGTSSTWVWSWTLWETELDVRAAMDEGGDRTWAIVVRTVTTAGVEQVQTAPWNLRGFCQRSWPVVRGLRFVREA